MLIIDISINRSTYTHNIGAVRIKPTKYTPKINEICTYKYGWIIDGRVKEEGTLDFPYKDSFELSLEVMKKMQNVAPPQNDIDLVSKLLNGAKMS